MARQGLDEEGGSCQLTVELSVGVVVFFDSGVFGCLKAVFTCIFPDGR